MAYFLILLLFVSRDIVGHPRDIPDAGAFEYRAESEILDVDHYIFKNWCSNSGKGDFDRDGVTNLVDYAILVEWWSGKENYHALR